MAQTLKKLPNAQYPIVGIFSFNFDDTMVNVAGVSKTFGDAAPGSFDIMTPPPGSIVIGGSVKVETPAAGNTSTVDVGDSDDTDRYTETAPVDLAVADAPFTAFDMLGNHKVYNGSQAIRITLANGGALSALKAHIVIILATPGKANENLKTV